MPSLAHTIPSSSMWGQYGMHIAAITICGCSHHAPSTVAAGVAGMGVGDATTSAHPPLPSSPPAPGLG